MKIVINKCYGGFSLSDKAYKYLIAKGVPLHDEASFNSAIKDLVIYKWNKNSRLLGKYFDFFFRSTNRNHPLLIEVVESLKENASGRCAQLEIVEIPDDVEYKIEEYDGKEWIAEKHRTWD